MAVSGNEFTRIGASLAGVGRRLVILAKGVSTAILYFQINDAILGATGGPTVNDGLALWFSKTTNECLADAERRWLLAFPATSSGTNQDLWDEYLTSLGHTGSLNDKMLAYWQAA